MFYPIQRMSDIIPRDELIEGLENILGDVEVIFDEGYYLEIYIQPNGVSYVNPEDIKTGNVDRGFYFFRYIDKECTYEELLNIFYIGSIKEETMTLTVIPSKEWFFENQRNISVPISMELDILRGNIA
ncbi:hypothetical protein CVD28_03820 [Bacillus sp. M6-12]|uniref:hypothetical protein n=1 Tax=Bacillus sp. M6-12 TaxID=2054166 RepID=UPI000C75E816|nr:hypothetical protein [Bacillus sp. M6-12]PLS19555.1 hypothetical protein CVD28_03820 [Bacillus sp. M6-12]